MLICVCVQAPLLKVLTNNSLSIEISYINEIQCTLYENGNITQERKIIDSVFPEKLTFDRIQFRTTRINEASEYMLLINSKIGDNICGTNPYGTKFEPFDSRTKAFGRHLSFMKLSNLK